MKEEKIRIKKEAKEKGKKEGRQKKRKWKVDDYIPFSSLSFFFSGFAS